MSLPIRVAIVGLSASAKTSWAAEAHLPYLLSPLGKEKYEIVALLNSSVDAARAARQHFELPSSIKVYGSPKDLAQDENVDLVVVNTRVDLHFPVARDSILANKAVYIEWPTTESLGRTLELIGRRDNFHRDSNIIGLQGRSSPVIEKVRQILSEGTIGRILSSHAIGYGGLLGRDSLPEGLSYFADMKVGGNPANIAYGHMIDYIHSVLGEFDLSTMQGATQIQRPRIKITGSDDKYVISDVPDFVTVHGKLASGTQPPQVALAESATLSVTYRSGQQFSGDPGFTWHINGELGELKIVASHGPYLQSDSYGEPITIDMHDHATGHLARIDWAWEDWQLKLPVRARLVANNYESFAGAHSGQGNAKGDWPRLQDSITRLIELDQLFKRSHPSP